MALRKRKSSDVELSKILDAYHATSPPVAGPASGVVAARCWQCGKATIYDGRRQPPRRCSWCKTPLI